MPSPTKAPPQGVGVAVADEPEMTMPFGTALKAVVVGSQIRRLAWPVDGTTIFMLADRLSIRKPDGSLMDLIVTVGDITAEGWVIVT